MYTIIWAITIELIVYYFEALWINTFYNYNCKLTEKKISILLK